MEAYFDFRILVVLLLIGAVIKHSPFLRKTPNKIIPFILMVSAVAILFVINDFSMNLDLFVTGIITGAASVGLHQSGKITFGSISTIVTNDIASMAQIEESEEESECDDSYESDDEDTSEDMTI